MADSMFLRIAPMLIVSFLMWSGARCVVDAQPNGPSADVHASFAAAPDVRIVLENVAGPVVISPSMNDTVDITAVKHAVTDGALAGIRVKVSKEGTPVSKVTVRTHYERDGHGGSVAYTLSVPRHAHLRISNVTGNIVANGFASDVSASDVSGNVTVENTDGNVKVRTVNGAIVASLTHFVNNRSVSLHTVSGPVSLTVPHDSGAVVKAQSMSGGFHSDFSLESRSEMIGSHVDGRIGNGAGWIDLESVSGTLDLKSSAR